jgi:hypothetical protein
MGKADKGDRILLRPTGFQRRSFSRGTRTIRHAPSGYVVRSKGQAHKTWSAQATQWGAVVESRSLLARFFLRLYPFARSVKETPQRTRGALSPRKDPWGEKNASSRDRTLRFQGRRPLSQWHRTPASCLAARPCRRTVTFPVRGLRCRLLANARRANGRARGRHALAGIPRTDLPRWCLPGPSWVWRATG